MKPVFRVLPTVSLLLPHPVYLKCSTSASNTNNKVLCGRLGIFTQYLAEGLGL